MLAASVAPFAEDVPELLPDLLYSVLNPRVVERGNRSLYSLGERLLHGLINRDSRTFQPGF